MNFSSVEHLSFFLSFFGSSGAVALTLNSTCGMAEGKGVSISRTTACACMCLNLQPLLLCREQFNRMSVQ